jgi:hypothetical protein
MTVQGDGVTPESPSSQAITALILSLLGFATCCHLLSPIAWYLGRQEQKAIRMSCMSPLPGRRRCRSSCHNPRRT